MVDKIVDDMQELINELKVAINQDINDVKNSKHDELFERNDKKNTIINQIMSKKVELNKELSTLIQNNIDVNIYRDKVNELEDGLRTLYDLNKKLANIVLPIKQMYKELLEEVSNQSGGQIFDIKA